MIAFFHSNVIAIKIAITVNIRWDGQDRGKIEFR
jgi:hypothetical protein